MVRDWVPLDRIGSAKIGPKGQIVIPKAMRDRADLKPGVVVFLHQEEDGEISVRRGYNSTMEAFEAFDQYPVMPGMEGKTALDILHEMDAEDEAIFERKYGPWTPASTSSMPNPSSVPSRASRSGRSSPASSRRRSQEHSNSE